jgi:hypothetical protein
MIRELLNLVPFWGGILFSMLFFLILGYCSALLSARFFNFPIDKSHRRLANISIGIMSAGLSILIAFVIINAWNYQLKARLAVVREANSIAVLLYMGKQFPPEFRDKLIKLTENYAVSVRIDEWKTMRLGETSPKAWTAIDKLFTQVQSYHPQTEREKLFYITTVKALNQLLELRRERINEIKSVIPRELKNALIIASILMVIMLGLIRGEADPLHIMPYLFFTLFIGFNLALALNFDYPFSGDISVTSRAFYTGLLGKIPDPSNVNP